MRDVPTENQEEGATALDPQDNNTKYKLNRTGTRPKAFSAPSRQTFSLFDLANGESSETQVNPDPEPASETNTQPSRPGNWSGSRIDPNTQFSRPPPFTAEQRLNLDKNNLLEEIGTLYARFDHSPIEAEKRKLKNLFYDRYEELSKAIEELRVMSADPDYRYQLRKDRDNANAFRNAFGPLETQKKQKHRIDPPEFDGDILKYHGWRNQWETYDSDGMYTVEEKFQMLTKCLKDEAAEATRSIAFSQANYRQILDILKNRFGSDSQAINQRKYLLREAAAAEVPEDYSSEMLTIKYNHIQNQILSLRSLGINTASYDEQISDTLMASLPESITAPWQRDWGHNVQPSLEQVLGALQREVSIKHGAELRRASNRPRMKDLNINAVSSKRSRSRTPTPGPRECIFCDNKTHPSFKCTENTIEKRREILS